jgi:hypothetical protein
MRKNTSQVPIPKAFGIGTENVRLSGFAGAKARILYPVNSMNNLG